MTNITGAVTDISKSVVQALPSQFIMLCVINIIFLGMVMWFLHDQIDTRTRFVDKIMSACLDKPK